MVEEGIGATRGHGERGPRYLHPGQEAVGEGVGDHWVVLDVILYSAVQTLTH